MSRRRRPVIIREAVATLGEHGHEADVDMSGAHIKIRWAANGRLHLLVVSRSPSDCRAAAQSRAVLRRILRASQ